MFLGITLDLHAVPADNGNQTELVLGPSCTRREAAEFVTEVAHERVTVIWPQTPHPALILQALSHHDSVASLLLVDFGATWAVFCVGQIERLVERML